MSFIGLESLLLSSSETLHGWFSPLETNKVKFRAIITNVLNKYKTEGEVKPNWPAGWWVSHYKLMLCSKTWLTQNLMLNSGADPKVFKRYQMCQDGFWGKCFIKWCRWHEEYFNLMDGCRDKTWESRIWIFHSYSSFNTAHTEHQHDRHGGIRWL